MITGFTPGAVSRISPSWVPTVVSRVRSTCTTISCSSKVPLSGALLLRWSGDTCIHGSLVLTVMVSSANSGLVFQTEMGHGALFRSKSRDVLLVPMASTLHPVRKSIVIEKNDSTPTHRNSFIRKVSFYINNKNISFF